MVGDSLTLSPSRLLVTTRYCEQKCPKLYLIEQIYLTHSQVRQALGFRLLPPSLQQTGQQTVVEEQLERPLQPLREMLSEVKFLQVFHMPSCSPDFLYCSHFPVLEGMGAPFSLLSAVSPTAYLSPQACFSCILPRLCYVAS